MTELFKHIRFHLFDGTNYICNLSQEFIIDGMPVYVKLLHSRMGKYVRLILYNIHIIRFDLDIECDNDYNLLNEPYLIKTLPDINDTVDLIITELKNIMKVLRFDVYLGIFVRNETVNPQALNTEISELFKDCEKVKINKLHTSDKCCVCLEDTVTKAYCSHHICFMCVIQLHPIKVITNNDIEEEEYEILCPVCREELLF